MLVKPNKKQINDYKEFAYMLSQDLSKSSYPTYLDGIKTKDSFMFFIDNCENRADEEILLYMDADGVAGWIHYYFIEDDKYLSFRTFNIERNTSNAIDEFLSYAVEKYPGYQIDFGFPAENIEALDHLEKLGFDRDEDSDVFVLHFNEYEPKAESTDIVKVDQNNWSDFKTLHDAETDGMYWNSERLYSALLGKTDREWNMYLYYENGKPVGNIYFVYVGDMMEIFGIDTIVDDVEVKKQLLIMALNKSKADGMKHMTFFTEGVESDICREIGMTFISEYVLYRK